MPVICFSMSQFLSAAGSLVDTIKVNSLSREHRGGRTFWIKRRRWAARPIMGCANGFFRLARNPIRALSETTEWQRWEVGCFLQLHGDHFEALTDGPNAVAAEEVPGRSLSQHLNAGTLSQAMFIAAGLELRRAHEMHSDHFHGNAWSHGDPHAGNFIYEGKSDRARLIDFEVKHHPQLSTTDRHAEDLLVLLQDIAGRIAPEQWLPSAHAFLGAYARPEVISALRGKLHVPGGFARIWWAVRTTYIAPAELRRRIAELRESL
jgi:hypothetical protein